MMFTVWYHLWTIVSYLIYITRPAHIVDMTGMSLTSVPQNINILVTDLKLDSNIIHRITNVSFSLYKELRVLSIQKIELTDIEDGSFDHNAKLEKIVARGNRIVYLPHSFGQATLSLLSVNFWCSLRYQAISRMNFTKMVRLKELRVGCAKYDGRFDASLLPPNLEEINLNYARLTEFPNVGRYAPNISTIRMGLNAIMEIPSHDIVGMSALTKLYLSDNKLSTVPDLFQLPLNTIQLSKNPIICNQSLCWLRLWSWMKASPLSTDRITCEMPEALANVLLKDINPLTLECQNGAYYW